MRRIYEYQKYHFLCDYIIAMNKSPKILGQGTYGCVVKPSAKCAESYGITDYKGKVSKMLTIDSAEDELHEYDAIQKFDPNGTYFMKKPISCFPKDKKFTAFKKCEFFNDPKEPLNPDEYKLLVMNDGGIDLYLFSKYVTANVDDYNDALILDFLICGLKLFKGVELALKYNFCHHDLKPQNIVYNEKLDKMQFIDFGISRPLLISKDDKDVPTDYWALRDNTINARERWVNPKLKSLGSDVLYTLQSEWYANKNHSHWSYPPELVFYNKNFMTTAFNAKTEITDLSKCLDKNKYETLIKSFRSLSGVVYITNTTEQLDEKSFNSLYVNPMCDFVTEYSFKLRGAIKGGSPEKAKKTRAKRVNASKLTVNVTVKVTTKRKPFTIKLGTISNIERELMKITAETFDSFGIGIALMCVLHKFKPVMHSGMYKKFRELFGDVTYPNPYERMELDEIIPTYAELIAEYTQIVMTGTSSSSRNAISSSKQSSVRSFADKRGNIVLSKMDIDSYLNEYGR